MISLVVVIALTVTALGRGGNGAIDSGEEAMTHGGAFGTCCSDLKDAMTEIPESFFRVEDNGVLYLTVEFMPTEDGPGFFDQAVLYCPFCGKQLQERDDIAAKADR